MLKTIPIADAEEFLRLVQSTDADRVQMAIDIESRTPQDSNDPKWRTQGLLEFSLLAAIRVGDDEFRLHQSFGVWECPAFERAPLPQQLQDAVAKIQGECVCRGVLVTFDLFG